MCNPPARRRAAPRAALALACAALSALACASAAPAPVTPGLSRVVLAPLNLGGRTAPELAGSEGAVWDELLRYLHAQDARVRIIDRADAAALWREAAAEVARGGEALGHRAISARFALRLREQVDYDVLVLPSLVLRGARIGGRRATWDGTRRKLPMRPRVPADLAYDVSDLARYRGTIAAASLYVALVGPDGGSLFEGLAGLEVVQQLVRGRRMRGENPWHFEARSDPFADPEGLRAGVERAFERPLPETARSR